MVSYQAFPKTLGCVSNNFQKTVTPKCCFFFLISFIGHADSQEHFLGTRATYQVKTINSCCFYTHVEDFRFFCVSIFLGSLTRSFFLLSITLIVWLDTCVFTIIHLTKMEVLICSLILLSHVIRMLEKSRKYLLMSSHMFNSITVLYAFWIHIILFSIPIIAQAPHLSLSWLFFAGNYALALFPDKCGFCILWLVAASCIFK